MGDCEGSIKGSSSSVVDREPGTGTREVVLDVRFSLLLVGEELSYGARLNRTGDTGDGGVLCITGAVTLPVPRRAVFRKEPFRFRVFACCIIAAIAPPAFPLAGLEGSAESYLRSALDALFPLPYPFSIMPLASTMCIEFASRRQAPANSSSSLHNAAGLKMLHGGKLTAQQLKQAMADAWRSSPLGWDCKPRHNSHFAHFERLREATREH